MFLVLVEQPYQSYRIMSEVLVVQASAHCVYNYQTSQVTCMVPLGGGGILSVSKSFSYNLSVPMVGPESIWTDGKGTKFLSLKLEVYIYIL